ncbi:hypothetical protein [Hydromonas duriensis]|nr:hypothetical protein [Hydromonas duriensis]
MSEVVQVQVMGKTYPIVVQQDDWPESPREWSNLGTMSCLHRRYKLGDEQLPISDYCEAMTDHLSVLAYERFIKSEFSSKYLDSDNDELNRAGLDRAQAWVEQNMIVLPLYLMDHSGLSMRTSPFGCSWDSGQVGFIFCTKDKARQELGVKRLTARHIERIELMLKNEVELYSNYLNGSVYCYHSDELDVSSGGFFGYDHDESGLVESAISDISWVLRQKLKSHHQKLKSQITHKVPLHHRVPLPF